MPIELLAQVEYLSNHFACSTISGCNLIELQTLAATINANVSNANYDIASSLSTLATNVSTTGVSATSLNPHILSDVNLLRERISSLSMSLNTIYGGTYTVNSSSPPCSAAIAIDTLSSGSTY